MTPEEQRKEQGEVSQGRVIALVKFGQSNYFLSQDAQATVKFEYIDPNRDALKFAKTVETLPQSVISNFDGVDANRVTLGQIGLISPDIEWAEQTSGINKPIITLHGKDGRKGSPLDIRLDESELRDLFLKNPGKEPSATFLTIPTLDQEVVAIALRRELPVLLTITPSNEGIGGFSSKLGLEQFLKNIYDNLSTDLSPLQWDVNEAIFTAMSPDGAIQFQYDNSTAARRTQRNILRLIYQIQGLLLAGDAEKNGNGLDDPALLAHVPFLKISQPQQQSGGLLGKLFGNQSSNPTQSATRVDNSLWQNLLAPVVGKVLQPMTTGPRVLPTAPVQQFQVPQMPRVDVSRPSMGQQLPERRIVQRPMTEKQKAIVAARNVEDGLQQALALSHNLQVTQVDMHTVDTFNTYLDHMVSDARSYLTKRRRVPGQISVSQEIALRPGILNVAGIRDQAAFEFLSGKQTNFEQKIAAAFQAWETYVKPLYINTDSRGERTLAKLKDDNGQMRKSNRYVAEMLYRAFDTVLGSNQKSQSGSINAGDLAHMLLSEQVLYTLREQYRQVLENGTAEDIDRWAGASLSTLTRLRDLWLDVERLRKQKA